MKSLYTRWLLWRYDRLARRVIADMQAMPAIAREAMSRNDEAALAQIREYMAAVDLLLAAMEKRLEAVA